LINGSFSLFLLTLLLQIAPDKATTLILGDALQASDGQQLASDVVQDVP
jgi:hypothetical protein